jgi:threonine synthase
MTVAAAVEVTPLPPVTCVRCGAMGQSTDPHRHRGCPLCLREGVPSNYHWEPDLRCVAQCAAHPGAGRGMWRYSRVLPVAEVLTLGEGGTPLLQLSGAGEAWGIPRLFAKNEAANPTWSHKDRLAAGTVAAARASGARVVAAASTGNHGAAVAAYAARAGMRCVIATIASVPPIMQDLMSAYGAIVVATATPEERYELIGAGVDELGWYPASNITVPAVGSDPYGVAAYRTIAYELLDELGAAPDWVILPVAYGDCLAGVTQGFVELHAAQVIPRVPRMVGAELFGALQTALDGGGLGPATTHPSAAFSIAGRYTTYQAVAALQVSDGFARSVAEDALADARRELGSREGLFVEAAAAAPFAVAKALAREGAFRPDDRVVCLLTSTGLKDERPSEAPTLATVGPGLDDLRARLGSSVPADAAAIAEVFPG